MNRPRLSAVNWPRLSWYLAAGVAGVGALGLPLWLLDARVGWLLLAVGLLALLAAALPGFGYAGAVPPAIGVTVLAAVAVRDPVGPAVTAVEAGLVLGYLVLLDLAESGAGRGGLTPQLPILLAAIVVAAGVLAAASLPPLPWLWLGLLALAAVVLTYRLAVGGHLPDRDPDYPG